MLRKLLGVLPAVSPYRVRAATLAPAARLPDTPHRRKPVFEALESRLLLSADPLSVLAPDGVLALQLGAGDDWALVERIGTSAAGGDIVAVTIGATTQQYGDDVLGIMRLLIDAGAGDDWLRVVGVMVTTDIIGGLGTDTFEWQQGDATWSITALDTGAVETVTFASFEHLVGADDARDTFLFDPGGGVSGGVDGGAGDFDSMVIRGGDFREVTHTATGSDSGLTETDDRAIAYSGLESVTLGVTVANMILNATAGDDRARLGDAAAAGQTVLESRDGTFASVTFVNPTESLTINLGGGDDLFTIERADSAFAADFTAFGGDGRDRTDFVGQFGTGGHDLKVGAETILVAPGAVVSTVGAGAVGDLELAAADASTDPRGAANASVMIVGAVLIGGNITISATCEINARADFIHDDSNAGVAIDRSEIDASRTLKINVRSLVSASAGAIPAAGDATDAARAEVTVRSAAAARIDGARLAAAGDIDIDVVNAVDVTAAGGPLTRLAVALETDALVHGGATLAGQNVNLSAASDASFALADVVAVADLESATRAGIAGAADIRTAGALLISATSLDRTESVSDAAAAIELGRALRGLAGDNTGMLPADAGQPGFDGHPAAALDDWAALAVNGGHDAITPDPQNSTRQLPEAGELAAEAFHAGPRDPLEEMIARELAAAGEFVGPGEPKSGLAGAALAAGAIAPRAALPPLAPETDAETKARQRASYEAGDHGEDDDAGLGASLMVSVIKDSTLAELARNVTTGGAVALSAGATPFVRGRARSAPEDGGVEPGGALEIGEAAAEAVVLAANEAAPGDAGMARGDLAADYRDALRFVAAGDIVLATAARHDLVGEASGGAERGTAVTAATPIDVASTDATAEVDADLTYTLAVAATAAAAPAAATDGNDGGFNLPVLAFEYFVGGERDAAIRAGDDGVALVGRHVIAVSGVLDPAPVALDGERGCDVTDLVACLHEDAVDGQAAASADLPIGDSRDVVMAYIGAVAAPIAASAGLPRISRRGDRLRETASRTVLDGRLEAVRGGGSWTGRFVNDLGLAADDPHPNAKIKIKL